MTRPRRPSPPTSRPAPPRCARIVEASSRNARAYHLHSPWREAAHAALRLGARLAPEAPLRRFDWLYGHDVTAG